jgi:hypothetical protein
MNAGFFGRIDWIDRRGQVDQAMEYAGQPGEEPATADKPDSSAERGTLTPARRPSALHLVSREDPAGSRDLRPGLRLRFSIWVAVVLLVLGMLLVVSLR